MESILKFASLLQQFRKVERTILVNGTDRRENDHEHSYALAMLAWYVNSAYALGLDQEKLFMYSLAHDLVEAYAGDVHFFNQTEEVTKDKHRREEEAAQKIEKEFPEFPELHEAIKGYERREDRESRFIYALDKVEPVINIYLDGGRTWKKNEVTLEMLTSMKMQKVSADQAVEKIFKELVERLEREHDSLFK